MCGICGIVQDGRPAAGLERVASDMAGAIAHRGPDGAGFHSPASRT